MKRGSYRVERKGGGGEWGREQPQFTRSKLNPSYDELFGGLQHFVVRDKQT